MDNLADVRKFSKTNNKVLCTDDDGNTALHIAAANARIDLLKEYFSDETYRKHINAENCMGWTPLMQASRYGHINCIKFLIKYGDIFKRNKYGLNAFTLACAHGNLVAAETLLHYTLLFGGKISEIENPISPLNFACLFNHQEVVKFLLLNGFSATHTSKRSGVSPLYCVKITSNKEIMALLKNSFASGKKIVLSPLKIPNVEITFQNQPASPKILKKSSNIDESLSPFELSPISPAFVPQSPNFFKMELELSCGDEIALTPLEFELGIKINNSRERMYTKVSSVEDSIPFGRLKISSSPSFLNNTFLCNISRSTTVLNLPSNKNCTYKQQIFFPPDFTTPKPEKPNNKSSNRRKSDTDFYDAISKNTKNQKPKYFQQNIYKLLTVLQENHLGHLIPIFVSEEIDFDIFLTLSENDLIEIGINSENDRDNILKIISNYQGMSNKVD